MDLVIDANILFAALIKEGKTTEIMFSDELRLYAPEYVFTEFKKYENEILGKTSRTREEFEKLVQVLERRIKIIPAKEIEPFLDQAKQITPDSGDVPYFAVALKLDSPIWTNDYRLSRQKQVKIITTAELAKEKL